MNERVEILNDECQGIWAKKGANGIVSGYVVGADMRPWCIVNFGPDKGFDFVSIFNIREYSHD